MSVGKWNLVFFGIEASDYADDREVLQIAMKCGSAIFNEYIDPLKPIDAELTKIHHLSNRNWHLYRDGSVMPSRPRQIVLQRLLEFLTKLEKAQCIFIAHHCYQHAAHFMKMIQDTPLEEKFKPIIAGFLDSFPMFKKKFPDKDTEHLRLHHLGIEVGVRWHHTQKNGRCVKHNAVLLERIALHFFTATDFEAEIRLQKKLQKFVSKTENESAAGTAEQTEKKKKGRKRGKGRTETANIGVTNDDKS